MSRLAVATPGGDAPGMNACLRAVVKHAAHRGLDVIGVRNGGLGLLRASPEHGDYVNLYSSSLANTLNRSGTVLKSSRQSRFEEFVSEQAGVAIQPGHDITRSAQYSHLVGKLARTALDTNRIDALILIGGDTTSRAAMEISKAYNGRLPVIVIPATIDNDIKGTVETIGFDSAVAMATTLVDAIRETASSMDRVFVVEVMGAQRGYIAVDVAVATGAEAAIIPEIEYSIDDVRAIAGRLARRAEQSHESAIAIVAEGAVLPPAEGHPTGPPGRVLMDHIRLLSPSVETRLSVVGHVLRGAPPTARTRNLAAKAGGLAVSEAVGQLETLRASKSTARDVCTPILIGIHVDGFLKRVEITGDMVRQDQNKLIRIVEEEVSILGY